MASSKENSQQFVRKSILRNPEITSENRDNQHKHVRINDFDFNHNENDSENILHKPTINKLAEMRKTLNEIKNYEAKELKSMDDLSKSTQQFVNRAVSSKLNFPINQKVFKNLPKISSSSSDEDLSNQRTVQKRAENFPKNTKRIEIQDYIREMVEAEYANEKVEKRGIINLPGEDDNLGLSKLNEMHISQSNRRNEFKRYHDDLVNDLYRTLFSSDNYCLNRVCFVPPTSEFKSKNEKNCKCLNDFYNEHSMCS